MFCLERVYSGTKWTQTPATPIPRYIASLPCEKRKTCEPDLLPTVALVMELPIRLPRSADVVGLVLLFVSKSAFAKEGSFKELTDVYDM
jgi:hypothetical protein